MPRARKLSGAIQRKQNNVEDLEERNLAILQPWNIVFAIGFVVYVLTRAKFARLSKNNEPADRRVGLQEKVLLPAMLITGLLFPVLYLFTPLFSFADYELPDWAHACGLGIMVAGLWFFWRSHADLGPNWSPTLETRKGHQIIQHGVYRRIRHPMYAGIWLFSIAQGLLLNNLLAGWAVVVAFTLMYFLRTPREEAMMIDQFGDTYKDYMTETGRLLPRIRPSTRNDSKPVH